MAVNSRVKSSSKVRMEAGPFESHKITDTSAEGAASTEIPNYLKNPIKAGE